MKNNCTACNMIRNGVKSRRAFTHTCSKESRKSFFTATFEGEPSPQMVAAVIEMANLAFKELEKQPPIYL